MFNAINNALNLAPSNLKLLQPLGWIYWERSNSPVCIILTRRQCYPTVKFMHFQFHLFHRSNYIFPLSLSEPWRYDSVFSPDDLLLPALRPWLLSVTYCVSGLLLKRKVSQFTYRIDKNMTCSICFDPVVSEYRCYASVYVRNVKSCGLFLLRQKCHMLPLWLHAI